MKIALVHDYLLQMGGAEKTLEALHEIYPSAPVYSSLYDAARMPPDYRTWDIRPSFLQRLHLSSRFHRCLLPFYPLAFEMLDLSGYDLIISDSSAFAKGVITPANSIHICYTHTPMRCAWSIKNYLHHEQMPRLSRCLSGLAAHSLRQWDVTASSRVDAFIANSNAVARRIYKYYHRESAVIYPPVETDRFQPTPEPGDYFLIVSRMTPYKRLDLAIEAFRGQEWTLKIAGAGRQAGALQKNAPANVEFLGRVSEQNLPGLIAGARAFILPGEEDFGIAAVEANAAGRPVIAYGFGGALETQKEGVTALFFEEQTVKALRQAIRQCLRIRWDPQIIHRHALRFDRTVFQSGIQQAVKTMMAGKEIHPEPELLI